MSAYVVENKTINKIITFLNGNQDMRSYLYHSKGIDLDTHEKSQNFGQRLLALNIQAVNERYNESESVFQPFEFHYELTDEIGAYKALRCLIYQCSEGDVPKTELYKTLNDIENYMAHLIISRLKIYDERPWG